MEGIPELDCDTSLSEFWRKEEETVQQGLYGIYWLGYINHILL